MRKSPSLLPVVVEVRDRTTLLPGEAPSISAPQLGIVIECLFALRENPGDPLEGRSGPGDGHSQLHLGRLAAQGEACCPACARDIDLSGFRRTRTSFTVRDEWTCTSCDQRFLLCEENVC